MHEIRISESPCYHYYYCSNRLYWHRRCGRLSTDSCWTYGLLGQLSGTSEDNFVEHFGKWLQRRSGPCCHTIQNILEITPCNKDLGLSDAYLIMSRSYYCRTMIRVLFLSVRHVDIGRPCSIYPSMYLSFNNSRSFPPTFLKSFL
jgi:hypothetical protein